MADWEVEISTPAQEWSPDKRKATTRGAAAGMMATDIPQEVANEYLGTAESMVGGASRMAGRSASRMDRAAAGDPSGYSPLQQLKDLIKDVPDLAHILGGAGYLAAGRGALPAAVGAGKSVVGHGAEAALGPENVDYEGVKGGVDTAMSMVRPSGARKSIPERPATAGITAPEGPITGSPLGKAGKEHVRQFGEQTQGQLGSARERIAGGFDPFGQVQARSGAEAGLAIQSGLQYADTIARKNVEAAGKRAEKLPAELSPKAAIALSKNIIVGAATGTTPVLLDPHLVPVTSKAVEFLQQGIMQGLKTDAGGRASGVNLSSLNAVRNGLLDFRRQALASGNQKDGEAMGRIIQEFDSQIDKAVRLTSRGGEMSSGSFSGDPRALQAWNYARNRSDDYYSKFKNQGHGTVGEIVENIVGANPHDPKTAQRVADMAYGGQGVIPTRLNVNVMKAVKQEVGAPSQTWSKVKQGVFFDIMTPMPGEFKPQLVRQRVNDFLKTEMASVIYSPQERATIRKFGEIHGTLDIIRGAKDPEVKNIAGKIAQGVGHLIGGGLGLAARLAGTHYASGSERRQLADLQRALPLIHEKIRTWERAVERAERSNTLRARHDRYAATLTLAQALRKFGISDIRAPQMANEDGKQDKLSTQRAFGGPQF